MPIPKPKPNERRAAFVGRCVKAIGDEYETKEQAVAVCVSTWDRSKKREKMMTEATEPFGSSADAEDFAGANEILFKQDDDDKGYTLVTGPVLVPESIDKQGDIVSADEIQEAAYQYVEDSQRAGLMHSVMLGTKKVPLVESFIAPQQLTINRRRVKKGSWVVTFKVYDQKLRKMIKDGTLNGFSIGGRSSVEDVD